MPPAINLRRGTDLTNTEKQAIISKMLEASDKNVLRREIAQEFRITEQSIADIMARDKLQRETDAALIIQDTKNRVRIATASEVDEIGKEISEAFKGMLSEDHNKTGYDYYAHISVIARDFDMDRALVEAYLIREFDWLSVRLYFLKIAAPVKEIEKDNGNTAQDLPEVGMIQKNMQV